jgi:Anti-sigma-K factor rskA/Putative zinc-finger
VDTPMSHSEYEELAAGYVLGALEPDDEQLFQRHLMGCPICEANLRELEAVAGELAHAVPPVEPPDTLWAGIRREIGSEAARPTPVPEAAAEAAPEPATVPAPEWAPARPAPAPRRRRRGVRLLSGLAAAAAILLVAVLSLWNLNLREENADYRVRVAALERATQLANDPNASLVALNDAPAPPGAQATVIASSRRDRGVLLVENLPPLQRDRVYELWGVPEGDIARAQKALVFVPLRRQGVQTLQFEVPIQPGTAFAITEEPGPDGSDKPTTRPILVGVPPSA